MKSNFTINRVYYIVNVSPKESLKYNFFQPAYGHTLVMKVVTARSRSHGNYDAHMDGTRTLPVTRRGNLTTAVWRLERLALIGRHLCGTVT